MTVLATPDLARLPAYAAALRRGWSPNTTRDVCAEQLAAIARDPAGFIRRLVQPEGGSMTMPTGETVPYLPGTTRWIWHDGFCGAINLRYVRGTTDLPPHVSGHVGYSVVPWRQRQGHGTAALRLMLPMAASAGLPYVILTCGAENAGSRRIIECQGGALLREEADAAAPGDRKRVYRIDLS